MEARDLGSDGEAGMRWDGRRRDIGASNATPGRLGIFLSVTELWMFLCGWRRVEVTNNGPSEGTFTKLTIHGTIRTARCGLPSSVSLSHQQNGVGRNTLASEPVLGMSLVRTVPL